MLFDVFDVCQQQKTCLDCCWDDVDRFPSFTKRPSFIGNTTTRKHSMQSVRRWTFITPLRSSWNRCAEPLSVCVCVCVCVAPIGIRTGCEISGSGDVCVCELMFGLLYSLLLPRLRCSTGFTYVGFVQGGKHWTERVFTTSPQPISYFSSYTVCGSWWNLGNRFSLDLFFLDWFCFCDELCLLLNIDTSYTLNIDTAWS